MNGNIEPIECGKCNNIIEQDDIETFCKKCQQTLCEECYYNDSLTPSTIFHDGWEEYDIVCRQCFTEFVADQYANEIVAFLKDKKDPLFDEIDELVRDETEEERYNDIREFIEDNIEDIFLILKEYV